MITQVNNDFKITKHLFMVYPTRILLSLDQYFTIQFWVFLTDPNIQFLAK